MTQESHLPPDCFRVRIDKYELSRLEGMQDLYVTSRLHALTSGFIQTTRIKPIQKSVLGQLHIVLPRLSFPSHF